MVDPEGLPDPYFVSHLLCWFSKSRPPGSMQVLRDVTPTPEQLKIFVNPKEGIEVIRGAAGSGKTTTALLKLKHLIAVFAQRKRRLEKQEPVRILVLTYNRTLRGYIKALAKDQTQGGDTIDLTIETFAKWAISQLGRQNILEGRDGIIMGLGANIPLPADFLANEIDYMVGRFMPENFDDYLTTERTGRGRSPRVDQALRKRILDEVIRPYFAIKKAQGKVDWNDLAIAMASRTPTITYDIVITDETQDFSANQIRAINNHLADAHAGVFVLDTAQRIYPRGFTWKETGLTVHGANSHFLENNYRNTVEIARFAEPLVRGLAMDEDAARPDFSSCTRHGPKPVVLKGGYGAQIDFTLEFIEKSVDLVKETVAFLHPLGGGWFRTIRGALKRANLGYVDLTRRAKWPEGSENVALCTLHSSKGLEFDHVIILGLNAEVTQHGDEEGDDQFEMLRRLLAMAIGRARESVILGYKPGEASKLVEYLDPATYQSFEV